VLREIARPYFVYQLLIFSLAFLPTDVFPSTEKSRKNYDTAVLRLPCLYWERFLSLNSKCTVSCGTTPYSLLGETSCFHLPSPPFVTTSPLLVAFSYDFSSVACFLQTAIFMATSRLRFTGSHCITLGPVFRMSSIMPPNSTYSHTLIKQAKNSCETM
jgi:hypothetical protein